MTKMNAIVNWFFDRLLPWLKSTPPKKKIPNYMMVGKQPGSEEVLTECIRNDGALAIRIYCPKRDIELVFALRSISGDGVTPIELTVAAHRNEDPNSEIMYCLMTGVVLPAAVCNRKEFIKLAEMTRAGQDIGLPDIKVVRLDPEDAEALATLQGGRDPRAPSGTNTLN